MGGLKVKMHTRQNETQIFIITNYFVSEYFPNFFYFYLFFIF